MGMVRLTRPSIDETLSENRFAREERRMCTSISGDPTVNDAAMRQAYFAKSAG